MLYAEIERMIHTVESEFGSSNALSSKSPANSPSPHAQNNVRSKNNVKTFLSKARKVQPIEVVPSFTRQISPRLSLMGSKNSIKQRGEKTINPDDSESDDEAGVKSNTIHQGGLSWDYLNQQRQRLFSLPPRDARRPLLSFLLFPVASICFEKRLDQLFLLSGKEAKAGLINEMSTHILIECLLLTITAQPIYNNQLDMHTIISKVACCLFYCTFHLELISILLHGLLVFALVENLSAVVPEWGMRRKKAILFVARLHMTGLALFFLCSIVWPISIFGKKDLHHKYAEYIPVIIVSLAPWIVVLYNIGSTTHSGIFDSLYPLMKLDLHPNDNSLRELAERDIAQYQKISKDNNDSNNTPGSMASMEPDLGPFLTSIHLSHLLPVFEAENIHYVTALLQMDNEDFRQLGVPLGDRTHLQCALFALPS